MADLETVDPQGQGQRHEHRLRVLLIGIVLGIGLALVVARVAGPYFSEVFSFGPGMEGEVVDKELEAERLLLRVSTEQGVLVALFTQNINEIDLLVESGDIVALSIDRYQPFVDNPGIESVQRPAPTSEWPGTEALTAKTAYVRKMEAQLELWEADISELRVKAEQASAELRVKYNEQLEALQKNQRAAREKLDELEQASDEAWEDLRAGAEATWEDLQTAVERAASRFMEEER